jgi:hypothetical protein
LRGYYDYESGRTEFYGNGGNYLRLSVDQPMVQEIETFEEPAQEESDEVAANNKWEKFKKRQDTMKELFDRLRGKFMDLFEDIDDKELK